ncbi:MAG: bile acid:sodium symporter family protein [Thermodesulfobacteriales bacterium]|nr:MAG: bile acid:sodium symporter family protein [Thermodesulfobacteriales bacterium]
MKYLSQLNSVITNYFTFWIIIFSAVAYFYPIYFADLRTLIVPTLGIIMFGMGVTLTTDDFKRVFLRPKDVGVGVVTQYTVMPFIGFVLAKMFGLDPLLAVGVVLVGSCPGGTSSNVMTYLARGDVAFSVTMTSVSTILAPIMLPFLMYTYAGEWINVPVLKLFISTVQIILLPVGLGVLLRILIKDKIKYVLPVLPSVSAAAIIFIVAVIVAANSASIASVGLLVAVIAIIHNTFGFLIGYRVARFFGMDVNRARAVSIEIGMQNSGLAVALANTYFGALAALPGAIFSVWMNISGSALAWWWRRSSNEDNL